MWERTAACALAVGAIPPVNLRVLAKRRSFPDAIDTFFSDAEYESQELRAPLSDFCTSTDRDFGLAKYDLREMPNARTAEVALALSRLALLGNPHGGDRVLALHGRTWLSLKDVGTVASVIAARTRCST